MHAGAQGSTPSPAAGNVDLSHIQHMMEAMQAQMQQQMLAMQRQISALAQTDRPASTAADTLPTPMPTFRRGPTNSRRLTFGLPSVAATPSTPLTSRSTGVRDEAEAEGESEPEPDSGPGAERTRLTSLKDALNMMRGFVPPFYADSTEDKGTVMDFVEKVESVMSDVLGDQPQHRLTIVRMFCREGALRWLNRKMEECKREGQPAPDWDNDIRKAFIEAHVGTDTVEMWLSKLGALRLGAETTKTPIELDNQFDTIARHIYPTLVAGDDRSELLLAVQYRDIIAASNFEMYKAIVRTQPHATLKEWKAAVSRQYNSEAQIKALGAQQRAAANAYRGYGYGHKGRGGQANQGGRGVAHGQAPQAAAMQATQDNEEGGEPHTTDDLPDPQQLTAADGSSRGGRGKGGRGGGGGGRGGSREGQPPRLSDERIQKLGEEGRCFRCGQKGHIARGCSNARVDLSKE